MRIQLCCMNNLSIIHKAAKKPGLFHLQPCYIVLSFLQLAKLFFIILCSTYHNNHVVSRKKIMNIAGMEAGPLKRSR